MLLTFAILCMDNTKFLLNLMIQEVGYFLQMSIFQLNFWTGAFGQLRPGEGRDTKDEAAHPSFMDWCKCGLHFTLLVSTAVVRTFLTHTSPQGSSFTKLGGSLGPAL